MLKLERSKKTRDISFRVRSRDPLFSRTIIIGFSIAIALHFSAALLFYIKPLLFDSETLLQASQVEIQFDKTPNPISTTSVERNERAMRYTIAAKAPSKPQIPTFPSTEMRKTPRISQDNPAFKEIESRYIALNNQTETYQYPYVPLQMQLSGALRSLQINTSSIAYLNLINVQTSFTQPIHYYVKFEIRVMNQSGRIYYDSIIESSGNPTFDQRARQILKQISFQPIKTGYDTTGEINLTLTDGSPHVF